jgi:hypothetical protein
MKEKDIVIADVTYGNFYLIKEFKEEFKNFSYQEIFSKLGSSSAREELFGKNNLELVDNASYRRFKGVVLSRASYFVFVKWENNHYCLSHINCLNVLKPFEESIVTDVPVDQTQIIPLEL